MIRLAVEHPDTQFYIFFPPYSAYYWDDLSQNGELTRRLDAHQLAIEMLLEYDNIHLFSFMDNIDIVYNLNYYKDSLHYNQVISDKMIDAMEAGMDQLTKENYMEYMNFMRGFYYSFEYDTLFE